MSKQNVATRFKAHFRAKKHLKEGNVPEGDKFCAKIKTSPDKVNEDAREL